LKIKKFLNWHLALIIILIVEFTIFSFLNPYFLNIDNLLFNVADFLYIALAALPMTLVIVTGGIDISVGSVMGLGSIVTALLWAKGIHIGLASIFGLGAGAAAGFLNGFLVVLTGVNPLVITLGSSFLISGVSLILSGMAGATGFEGISGLPMTFSNIANGYTFDVPNPVWILLIAFVLFYIILHKTKYGEYLYLIGMNPEAAKYSGISVKKILIFTYTLMGIGGAFSGIMLTSYFTSARADLGSGSALSVVTVAVLGGASIYGGKGTMIGTFIASLFIGYLKYGLQMAGISSQETQVFLGVVLIGTISGRFFWDIYTNVRKNKKALQKREKLISQKGENV
jgi:AI-2 transport system permease protein